MIITAVRKFIHDSSDLTLGKFTHIKFIPVDGKFIHDSSDLTLGKFTHTKFILDDGKLIIWGPGKYTQIWIVPKMFQQQVNLPMIIQT